MWTGRKSRPRSRWSCPRRGRRPPAPRQGAAWPRGADVHVERERRRRSLSSHRGGRFFFFPFCCVFSNDGGSRWPPRYQRTVMLDARNLVQPERSRSASCRSGDNRWGIVARVKVKRVELPHLPSSVFAMKKRHPALSPPNTPAPESAFKPSSVKAVTSTI